MLISPRLASRSCPAKDCTLNDLQRHDIDDTKVRRDTDQPKRECGLQSCTVLQQEPAKSNIAELHLTDDHTDDRKTETACETGQHVRCRRRDRNLVERLSLAQTQGLCDLNKTLVHISHSSWGIQQHRECSNQQREHNTSLDANTFLDDKQQNGDYQRYSVHDIDERALVDVDSREPTDEDTKRESDRHSKDEAELHLPKREQHCANRCSVRQDVLDRVGNCRWR